MITQSEQRETKARQILKHFYSKIQWWMEHCNTMPTVTVCFRLTYSATYKYLGHVSFVIKHVGNEKFIHSKTQRWVRIKGNLPISFDKKSHSSGEIHWRDLQWVSPLQNNTCLQFFNLLMSLTSNKLPTLRDSLISEQLSYLLTSLYRVRQKELPDLGGA